MKQLKILPIFLVFAVLVFGCTQQPANPPAPQQQVPEVPEPPITTTPELPQQDTSPITIGAMLPLTGDLAEIGQTSLVALQLAVEEVNNDGGINGRTLEVVVEDSKCSPEAGANSANKLVNIDNVPVIIGEICSGATLAAAPIAESGEVVMLSPCSSNPSITDAGDYIFRDYPSDSFQGKVAAEYAFNSIGARKVGVLSALSDWGTGLAEVFEETFTSLGGEIVASEQFPDDTKDLKTELTKIKDSSSDLIYFVSYTDAGIIGLQQAQELGIETQILGGDAWGDPTIPSEAGSAADGAMYLQPKTATPQEFNDKMAAKGKEQVTICSPNTYDAVKILAMVMETTGTDSSAIKDALYDVQGYSGVSGEISFDEQGDLKNAEYEIYKYENSEIVKVEEVQ